MAVRLTKALSREYVDLFQSVEILHAKFSTVDTIVKLLIKSQSIYERVADPLQIPWYVVAAIHNMESSQNFKRHLHNGDPLNARTKQVPAGRPKTGTPPFTWEQSAIDALKLRKLHKVNAWNLPNVLYELEGYNGWGYRQYHAHVKSPYLWSGGNHYTRGKYIADGTWSDTAKSAQIGAAVIIKRMEQQGAIETFSTAPMDPVLKFAKGPVARGEDLQRFLNTFEGISLRVDGWTGSKTSDATETVFGFSLHGDPDN
ncbi:hypothetical protein N9850_04145 [Granulosicoccus sp.]|nr:hypothetical protein [Granulosicoccus sp.]MDB4222940.1 hypothetical protein [Granulosicoccus sp.]